MRLGTRSRRLSLASLLFAAAASFGTCVAAAAVPPNLCNNGGRWISIGARAPAAVGDYLRNLGDDHFDMRAACAHWAGGFSRRHQVAALNPDKSRIPPPRLVLFPSAGTSQRELVDWLKHTGYVRDIERATHFVVAVFSRHMPTARLRDVLDSPQIDYAEPDCDGPDFLTTSADDFIVTPSTSKCWQRGARAQFPNDPCMDELWGHQKIGWDSSVAARSLPRLLAVLDSGIDAALEDREPNIMAGMDKH